MKRSLFLLSIAATLVSCKSNDTAATPTPVPATQVSVVEQPSPSPSPTPPAKPVKGVRGFGVHDSGKTVPIACFKTSSKEWVDAANCAALVDGGLARVGETSTRTGDIRNVCAPQMAPSIPDSGTDRAGVTWPETLEVMAPGEWKAEGDPLSGPEGEALVAFFTSGGDVNWRFKNEGTRLLQRAPASIGAGGKSGVYYVVRAPDGAEEVIVLKPSEGPIKGVHSLSNADRRIKTSYRIRGLVDIDQDGSHELWIERGDVEDLFELSNSPELSSRGNWQMCGADFEWKEKPCPTEWKTQFDCAVEKGNVTVCSNGDDIHYRFGPRGGKPELAIVGARKPGIGSNVHFAERMMGGFGQGNSEREKSLRFDNGAYSFVVYDFEGVSGKATGLAVLKPNGKTTNMACIDKPTVDFDFEHIDEDTSEPDFYH